MYQGRKMRRRIKRDQNLAASIIQRMARKKLRKIREIKNVAAGKIQRTWRKKRLIWIALLRCIYRQTIKTLHSAATIIQRKWRNWHSRVMVLCIYGFSVQKFSLGIEISKKNQRFNFNTNINISRSGRCSKYNYSLVETILCKIGGNQKEQMGKHRLFFNNTIKKRNQNALTIQKLYRGYKLRSMLRPDIREKLAKVGKGIYKARYPSFPFDLLKTLQRPVTARFSGIHYPKSMAKLSPKKSAGKKSTNQASCCNQDSSCMEWLLGAISYIYAVQLW